MKHWPPESPPCRVFAPREAPNALARTPGKAGYLLPLLLAVFPLPALAGKWEQVLKQIDVPHHYYYREMYLPQLTAGPGSLAWSPDSKSLIYSMQGSLWLQSLDSQAARQLTAGPGYDYQPDWSPDGKQVIFARYDKDAVELHLLDLDGGEVRRLTRGGAVNVEPRWSPDGTRIAWVSTQGSGHFHVYTGSIGPEGLAGMPLRAERKSSIARYYYSPFDHELSPTWSPDGRELILVANPETPYGTGSLWRVSLDDPETLRPVRIEETTWKARPDWSPDGRRVIYSSYLGRQWHQLWVTTAQGGDPFPLTYGEFDATQARWSPDAGRIAWISNENGNTAIRIQEATGGATRKLGISERQYLDPVGRLAIEVRGPGGEALAARIAVTGPDGRAYFPDDAWAHASDGFDRKQSIEEPRYFHTDGKATVTVPVGTSSVTVWRGLEQEIAVRRIKVKADETPAETIVLKPLDLPAAWGEWTSADLHVHMNYGGVYRNTSAQLLEQARAEDLDMVRNLVVNKEQRIPDIHHFTPGPDPVSTSSNVIFHDQEFHTSVWGHVGLLGLAEHYLLPDYAAYPYTAAASLWPNNSAVADLAHAQQALVGYVHPFDTVPAPESENAFNSLPVDAALGKVDYYEVVGFADPRASAEVWYRLLNCGMRIAAGAGTDAMANYASLRGPLGMNRVYVRTGAVDLRSNENAWKQALKAGHSMVTNGPLLMFSVEGKGPGESLEALEPGRVRYAGVMRSIVPVDHLEIVVNGEVAKTIRLGGNRRKADFEGEVAAAPGDWILLRAWNEGYSTLIFDLYPYASTSPVYMAASAVRAAGKCNADYFLRWIEDIETAAASSTSYNTDSEKQRILEDIRKARGVFESRR